MLVQINFYEKDIFADFYTVLLSRTFISMYYLF